MRALRSPSIVALDPHEDLGVDGLRAGVAAPQPPGDRGEEEQRQRRDDQQPGEVDEVLRPEAPGRRCRTCAPAGRTAPPGGRSSAARAGRRTDRAVNQTAASASARTSRSPRADRSSRSRRTGPTLTRLVHRRRYQHSAGDRCRSPEEEESDRVDVHARPPRASPSAMRRIDECEHSIVPRRRQERAPDTARAIRSAASTCDVSLSGVHRRLAAGRRALT